MKIRGTMEGRAIRRGESNEGIRGAYSEPQETEEVSEFLEGDGSEIAKLMQEIDMSVDEDDYSDCGKQPEEQEEESYEDCEKEPDKEEKEDTFEDCLKKATKSKKEVIEDYEVYIRETEQIIRETRDEVQALRDSIEDIFG